MKRKRFPYYCMNDFFKNNSRIIVWNYCYEKSMFLASSIGLIFFILYPIGKYSAFNGQTFGKFYKGHTGCGTSQRF